jgi:hypothetical protein
MMIDNTTDVVEVHLPSRYSRCRATSPCQQHKARGRAAGSRADVSLGGYPTNCILVMTRALSVCV